MPSPLPFGRDEGPWGADTFAGTTADQLGRHSQTSLPSLAAATAAWASPSQWQRRSEGSPLPRVSRPVLLDDPMTHQHPSLLDDSCRSRRSVLFREHSTSASPVLRSVSTRDSSPADVFMWRPTRCSRRGAVSRGAAENLLEMSDMEWDACCEREVMHTPSSPLTAKEHRHSSGCMSPSPISPLSQSLLRRPRYSTSGAKFAGLHSWDQHLPESPGPGGEERQLPPSFQRTLAELEARKSSSSDVGVHHRWRPVVPWHQRGPSGRFSPLKSVEAAGCTFSRFHVSRLTSLQQGDTHTHTLSSARIHADKWKFHLTYARTHARTL